MKRFFSPFYQYIALLSLFILTLIIFRCNQPAATTYSSLDKNTKYVGNKTCASCHKDIYESYLQTGMGKSFYQPNKANIIEKFDEKALVYDTYSNFYYFPYWAGDSMYVMEFRLEKGDTTYKRVEKIDYIVGSGHQTRSYLLAKNDYYYEVPITWYVSKQIWALSPGYDKGNNSRFNREIGEECMACHTGNFEFVEDSKHRFHKIDLGIDCERCHGAAGEHIAKMQKGDEVDVGKEIDYSIVNPEKLTIDKQFDICQQCHLQGTNIIKTKSVRDFKPAMNLKDVYDIFLEEPQENEFGIASHADRLKQSKCFLQSGNKLTCTTCHNPHESVHKTDANVYIKQCQNCHKEKGCKETVAAREMKQDNCVTCHLPKGGTNDIPHVSFHDHKIRVVKNSTAQEVKEIKEYVKLIAATSDKIDDITKGKAHLQYFERHNKNAYYLAEADKLIPAQEEDEKARVYFYQGKYNEAITLANQALTKGENKVLIYFLLGEIYEKQNNFKLAFDNYEKAYQANPEAVEAGLKAGTMMLKANVGNVAILPQAQVRFETLLALKPKDERIHTNLGFVLMNQQKFPIAEKYFLQSLALNPDYQPAVENLMYLSLATNEKVKAQSYFDKLLKINPNYANKEAIKAQLK
ncbi:MAG: tetratricopeptide repeat protein [Bacteroidia bacterium]